MVVVSAGGEQTNRLFHALSDPTRRDILATVLGDERSVSALADAYPMSFAAVQKHVAVLERAGLVNKRRRGREQLVSGEVRALHEARGLLDGLEALWRGRLERIGRILDESDEGTAP